MRPFVKYIEDKKKRKRCQDPMTGLSGSIFVRIQRGDRGPDPPLKNHKNIRFLSNTGLDTLKNHKAAKPEFNNGPSLARQRNTI